MSNILYLDIETKPDPDRVAEFMKPFPAYDPFDCKIGNLKDPDKIAAKLEQHQSDWAAKKAEHEAKAHDRAALSPATGSILCIQLAVNDAEVMVMAGEEREILHQFSQYIEELPGEVVTWSGSNSSGNFDLNFLHRRAWAHRVSMIEPYRVKDLTKHFLQYADWGSYLSLENAAKELGIEVEDTGVTGKEFHLKWESDREAAMKYATQDVELLRKIYKRIVV